MGPTKRRIGMVLVGIVAVLLVAPGAQGARKPGPKAHIACASTGCTEVSTDQLPAKGEGETMTDTIPLNADQGSIQAAPTCATTRDAARAGPPPKTGPFSDPWAHVACGGDAVQAFTQMLDTVVTDLALQNVKKKKNQRVIACAFLSLTAVNYSSELSPGGLSIKYSTSGGVDRQAAFLGLCLQVAAAISAAEASGTTAAVTASAGCSQGQAAITVSLTRVGARYQASAKSQPRLLRQPSPIAVSCRRAGVGLKLAITPRRHRTFRKVGVRSLAIGYANASKTPVAVRTTFKVN